MAFKKKVRSPVRRMARLVAQHMDRQSGKQRSREEMNALVKKVEQRVVPLLVKRMKAKA